MNALFFLLIGLTLVVLFAVMTPFLWFGGGRTVTDKTGVRACREQLLALERDRQTGMFDETEAERMRLEIQRRLLSLSPLETEVRKGSWLPLFLIIVGLPLGSFGFYLLLGSPSYPDLPYRERMMVRSGLSVEENDRLYADVRNVSEALKDNPDSFSLWRSLGDLNRYLTAFDQAAEAYRNALHYGDRQMDTLVSFGEMLVWSAPDGIVSPEAAEVFNLALKRMPDDPRALYYTGLRAAQREDPGGALEIWERLLRSLPPDSPLRVLVQEDIGRIHALVGIDPVTGPEVQGRIEYLITELAAQLEKQPDHREGWVALGRAYVALGRAGDAREAFQRALALAEPVTAERREIEELMRMLEAP